MAMTWGSTVFFAQSQPNISTSCLRFVVAASRTENTVSPNQEMHSCNSLSSKNSTPSWEAKNGMYSMMAKRTRHCLSSASSTMAGSKENDSRSTPMTIWNGVSLVVRYTLTYLCSRSRASRWCSVWLQKSRPWAAARKGVTGIRSSYETSTVRGSCPGILSCSRLLTRPFRKWGQEHWYWMQQQHVLVD